MPFSRITILIAALAMAVPAAAESGWTRVGQRQVSDSVERDRIEARGGVRYRQLMVCVEEAPLRFVGMVVRYRNGGSQDVPLRELIRAGGCSRDIQLRGRDRDVEAVDFSYEAASLGRARARVDLFAR